MAPLSAFLIRASQILDAGVAQLEWSDVFGAYTVAAASDEETTALLSRVVPPTWSKEAPPRGAVSCDDTELTIAAVEGTGNASLLALVGRPRSDEAWAVTVASVEALVESRKDSQRLGDDTKELLSAVSHDLRSPTNAIYGFAEILLMDYKHVLDEEGIEIAERILQGVRRIKNLLEALSEVKQLMVYSYQPMTVDVDALVDEAIATVVGRTPSLAGSFHKQGTFVPIAGDVALMRTFFAEALGNTVKFRAADRPLAVTITGRHDPGDELATITIEDNGIGMDPKFKDRIFRLFRKLHPDDVYPGAGRGLTLVKEIARLHGGSVSAHGVPRERFVLELKVAVGRR